MEWHTIWIEVADSLQSTSSFVEDQVMVLTVGHNADLFQVKLGIVPPGMFSSGSFGTDDQLSICYLFIRNFQNLLEVIDEWIVLMEAILNSLEKFL